MKLELHEINSPTWQKINAHLNEELKAMRARAENPKLPHDDRQGLLWRIYEIKEILELAEPASKGDGRKP
jgi:hypothetical protein